MLLHMLRRALTTVTGRAGVECCRSVWLVLAGAMSNPRQLLSGLVGGALRHVQATGSSEVVPDVSSGRTARLAEPEAGCLHVNSMML